MKKRIGELHNTYYFQPTVKFLEVNFVKQEFAYDKQRVKNNMLARASAELMFKLLDVGVGFWY